MDAPDLKGRRAILDVHVHGKPLAADVDLDVVAKQTPGFAGADIENLVNEAAILSARRNRRWIELQEAIERVIADQNVEVASSPPKKKRSWPIMKQATRWRCTFCPTMILSTKLRLCRVAWLAATR